MEMQKHLYQGFVERFPQILGDIENYFTTRQQLIVVFFNLVL